ncbi:unnamed protein product [Tuber melanosporum]|uniref:Protein YIP n=1 Tax=Tuber melanosporum (strain Mel28) TaxID=656061 RepID=D5GD90_TUBMM|nr:uncharacterized protein GSTUM_00006096001 [Tuber melanosporum]CAZ82483.1 unnamed protein product [Tuber melanosporum]
MANFFQSPPPQQQPHYGGGGAPNNLQFYPSSYSSQTQSPQGYGFGGMGSIQPGGAVGSGSREHGLTKGWLAAFGTSGYDDEPPLLEELGVNFGHIKMKTLMVLNPMASVDQHMMDDSDVAGPILFYLLFGAFLLLSGKVHFGYIYGVALLGSISLHLILNLMSPPTTSLNYIRSASVLGYCLLPLVFTSALGIGYNMNGFIGYILSAAAIGWCTYSASNMFIAVLRVRDMRLLVAYPLGLFYSVFGIMAIFGGRGGTPPLA